MSREKIMPSTRCEALTQTGKRCMRKTDYHLIVPGGHRGLCGLHWNFIEQGRPEKMVCRENVGAKP